jgi:hypothetical protein
MKLTTPDFFVFNGDQIYADGTCNDLTNLVKNNYRYWQNIEGNFKRVNDIDWNDQDKLNKTFYNIGITTEKIHIYRIFLTIHLCIHNQMIMK